MSFKQKSSPLKQGFGLEKIVSNGMTAAQIAFSNTPAGAAAALKPPLPPRLTGLAGIVQRHKEQVAADAEAVKAKQRAIGGTESASNFTAEFGPDHFVTKGREAAAAAAGGVPTANTISPVATSASSQRNRGQNWFGAVPTNTVGGGPQSVMQGTHGVGINRRDSHNTTYADRTNGGSTNYSNNLGGRSSMFSPFPQLKKEQMEYNKISPKAFSNSGTIEKMMGKAVPNSPFMQMVDPLTGLTIDPTMSQDPNAPLPPPSGVQTPTTPIYDINNY